MQSADLAKINASWNEDQHVVEWISVSRREAKRSKLSRTINRWRMGSMHRNGSQRSSLWLWSYAASYPEVRKVSTGHLRFRGTRNMYSACIQ